MRLAFWRRSRPSLAYMPQPKMRTADMMYHVAGAGDITDAVGVAELLDTFVAGFEDQLTAQVARLARDAGQSFVAEPMRLLFRGPARERTWQRAWKVVSSHEVMLRVTVEVDEADPDVVRGCVNTGTVAESRIGRSEPESSAHLSGRVSYFRDQLLANAHAVMEGQQLVAKRRADLIGHQAPAVDVMRAEIERLSKSKPLF